ncbi:MAG: hypothetical protein U5L72_03165 [Bacteroidales bacterium]|nr:hypothetical protein [Bacteroidales bacterium]
MIIPVFKKAVEKIFMTARNAGIGAGIHVFDNDAVKWEIEWAGKGANLILHSGDINRFAQVIHDDIRLSGELSTVKVVQQLRGLIFDKLSH